MDIAALGLDSVQVMEMVAWLEERLAVRIPDDELATVTTLDDLCAMLAGHRAVPS